MALLITLERCSLDIANKRPPDLGPLKCSDEVFRLERRCCCVCDLLEFGFVPRGVELSCRDLEVLKARFATSR